MKKTPYRIVTIDDVSKALDSSLPLMFDTETVKLYGRIRLAQFYQESWEEVLTVEWPNPYILTALLDTCTVVMQNAHYDITTIQEITDTRWVPNHFEDTFLLSRLYFPDKQKYSLDDLFIYALKRDVYKQQGLDKTSLQKSNWNSTSLTEDQYVYAATDVYYLPQLYNMVKEKISDFSYKLDMLTLGYCLDFQWNGMQVDDEAIGHVAKETAGLIREAALPINANSYVQVRKWLGTDASDGLALARMALADPDPEQQDKAKRIVTVRKARKLDSFLKKFDTVDGMIYGKFKPSTRSGRLASDDQNLQQIPRALKKVFREEHPMLFADYAQLELRTICAITNCGRMIELFRADEDLHSYTAKMLFGEVDKTKRQIAKTCNFNLLYYGSAKMLQSILIKQANLFIEEEECKRLRKRWRNLWPEIASWQDRGVAAWRKGRIWHTPVGRGYVGKLMTDQLNIMNQGFGAEVAKLALHYQYPKMTGLNNELINFVHDSYLWRNLSNNYEESAEALANAMQEAWFEMAKLTKVPDLPMPVDVSVAHRWVDADCDDPDVKLFTFKLNGMENYNAAV